MKENKVVIAYLACIRAKITTMLLKPQRLTPFISPLPMPECNLDHTCKSQSFQQLLSRLSYYPRRPFDNFCVLLLLLFGLPI